MFRDVAPDVVTVSSGVISYHYSAMDYSMGERFLVVVVVHGKEQKTILHTPADASLSSTHS